MGKKFSIRTVVERALNYSYFDKAIEAHYSPQNGRLLLITGDNSSGKSFFGKLFSEIVSRGGYEKTEVMRVSMELRTAGSMANVFIFGPESWKATGEISVRAVLGGINTCKNRKNDHILFLDEPDIGLSESYQGALGETIKKFAENLPEKTKALCIVTHSRRLVKNLVSLNPHHLRLGDNKSLQQFLEDPEDKTVEELENLAAVSLKRYRDVQRCIDGGKDKSGGGTKGFE